MLIYLLAQVLKPLVTWNLSYRLVDLWLLAVYVFEADACLIHLIIHFILFQDFLNFNESPRVVGLRNILDLGSLTLLPLLKTAPV